MKEYTKEELIGKIYIHKSDLAYYPKKKKQISNFRGNSGSTIDLDINENDSVEYWFSLHDANEWINDGVWILDGKKEEIINNYSIY